MSTTARSKRVRTKRKRRSTIDATRTESSANAGGSSFNEDGSDRRRCFAMPPDRGVTGEPLAAHDECGACRKGSSGPSGTRNGIVVPSGRVCRAVAAAARIQAVQSVLRAGLAALSVKERQRVLKQALKNTFERNGGAAEAAVADENTGQRSVVGTVVTGSPTSAAGASVTPAPQEEEQERGAKCQRRGRPDARRAKRRAERPPEETDLVTAPTVAGVALGTQAERGTEPMLASERLKGRRRSRVVQSSSESPTRPSAAEAARLVRSPSGSPARPSAAEAIRPVRSPSESPARLSAAEPSARLSAAEAVCGQASAVSRPNAEAKDQAVKACIDSTLQLLTVDKNSSVNFWENFWEICVSVDKLVDIDEDLFDQLKLLLANMEIVYYQHHPLTYKGFVPTILLKLGMSLMDVRKNMKSIRGGSAFFEELSANEILQLLKAKYGRLMSETALKRKRGPNDGRSKRCKSKSQCTLTSNASEEPEMSEVDEDLQT